MPPSAEKVTPAPAAHELTAIDLEAFLDGLIPLQIAVNDIAGATVAIVKDGKVLFAKGYGEADVATHKPVTPDTLFRIGSITKLFVWTSVMQLVEQGKIELDADVNAYLDFRIAPAFDAPITVRDLMTHRPGFEEAIKEIGVKTAAEINLETYLKEHLPAQIFKPGQVPAYSNYGAALAGYIVQRVSGVPFDQYVEDNILKQLGMSQTTLRQPLPDSLRSLMSSGYNLASDKASEFELIGPYPAGSMSASAMDMTRFMLAHLQDGQLDGQQILKPETAQAMHNTRLLLDPAVNAMALGFYEEARNGHRIIGHGGDTLAFHSDMHLIMDANVGLFVSYNSQGRGDTSPRSQLWRRFLDRYFPYTPPDEPTLASAKEDAKKVVGTYIVSRRSETSFLKLLSVVGEATVSAKDDGTIELDLSRDLNGKPRRWREVGPLIYRNVAGQEKIVFKPDASGNMTIVTGTPIAIYQRVGLFDDQLFVSLMGGVSLAVMSLVLLLTPLAMFVRRHYGIRLERGLGEQMLRVGTYLVCAADVGFLVALGLIVVPALETIFDMNRSLDPTLHVLQRIGLAGAVGSFIPVVNAGVALSSANRGVFGKIKEVAVAAAAVAFAWFAWAMHLLNMNLHY